MFHKSERGSITYSTNREKTVRKIFLICLSSNGGEIFQFKQTFKLSRSVKYSLLN